MKWLIKHELYDFQYNSKEQSDDTRWNRLQNAIASEGQSGWEPWGIDVKHNFNRDYTVLVTVASVWFKRNDQ